ncbi:MAG: N-acetylneuraminate synthase family protein [bacterium]
MFIVFELANSHDGDIHKAIRMVDEFHSVAEKYPQFEYGFKTQYRSWEFFHPDCDPEHPYVKRFKQAQMADHEWKKLVFHIKNLGHKAVCTPFDEKSVQKFVEHEYDILKIGSPSVTDWALLTEIHYGVQGRIPIIMSVGGATEQEINGAIYTLARDNITLLHCWSEYPTDIDTEERSQVYWLKTHYPQCKIGYSCHQDPSKNMIIPLDMEVLEFHVCLLPKPNKYSIWSEKMDKLLETVSYHRETRIPGPKPTQFMRKPYGEKWYWNP